MVSSIPIENELFLYNSIWPIYATTTGTTILGQSEPGSNCNDRVIHITQITELEPHHQIQFSVIPMKFLFVGVLSFAGRYNQRDLSLAQSILDSIFIQ